MTFEMGDPDAYVGNYRAGLVDELHLDVMPVLLGAGISLFGDPALAGLQLEELAVEEVGPRTTLRFRVVG
jgi:riboflavin biosynthesis pyrimidine reductase